VSLVDRLFGQHAGMVHDDDFRLLLAANAMGALGTALVSPVLDSLTGPFGVSAAQIGLVVTAVAAPSIVLIPLSGALTDRFGRKPVLVTGLLGFGGGGLAIAFTTDFAVVLALRALQGAAFAGVTPVIITCLGDLYDGDAETTAQGIRFGTSGLSQAFFPAVAGIAVAVAWQYPFFIYGVALPVAVAVALFFEEPTAASTTGVEATDGGTDSTDGGTDSTDGGTDSTDGGTDSTDGGTDSTRGYVVGLATIARRRRTLAFLLARSVVVLPFIGFLTYNSLVVSRLQGGTPGQAGLLVALFSVVYAVTATQSGRIAARFDRPTLPLVAANLALGGGLVVFVLAPSAVAAAPAVTAMGVGVGVTFSLYRSIITGLAPQSFRGGLVSLSESGGRVAATVAPVGIGGALALAEPSLGGEAALQWVVAAAGLFSAGVGVASVAVAHLAAPVPAETD
jgi:MFS family permease